MNNLSDSRHKIKSINSSTSLPLNEMMGQSFEERHKKLTIYLEHVVYKRLQQKRQEGISQTKIINQALKEYFED